MYDIIIVGGGPAGLSSALYALRAGKKVLVLEARNYGGKIISTQTIQNYPGIQSISGYDFATALYNQVLELGMDYRNETVINITKDKKVFTNKGSYEAKAIILATGTDNRRLSLNKESDFVGKGISYCATCDGALYKNKIVAVVGGGNSALEDALYLSNIAQKVYLIHRRDSFSGEQKYVEELQEKENIEFILNSNIIKLNGTEKLESIEVQDQEKNTKTLEIDGLFIDVGHEPKNDIFSNIININKQGYIETTDGVHTNIEGIYAAGDARVKELRQLTTAVSDGSIAATIAIKEMK